MKNNILKVVTMMLLSASAFAQMGNEKGNGYIGLPEFPKGVEFKCSLRLDQIKADTKTRYEGSKTAVIVINSETAYGGVAIAWKNVESKKKKNIEPLLEVETKDVFLRYTEYNKSTGYIMISMGNSMQSLTGKSLLMDFKRLETNLSSSRPFSGEVGSTELLNWVYPDLPEGYTMQEFSLKAKCKRTK